MPPGCGINACGDDPGIARRFCASRGVAERVRIRRPPHHGPSFAALCSLQRASLQKSTEPGLSSTRHPRFQRGFTLARVLGRGAAHRLEGRQSSPVQAALARTASPANGWSGGAGSPRPRRRAEKASLLEQAANLRVRQTSRVYAPGRCRRSAGGLGRGGARRRLSSGRRQHRYRMMRPPAIPDGAGL